MNHPQKMVFDFKNKFPKENSSISKNTSDIKIKENLIDDSNEETKKTKSIEEQIEKSKETNDDIQEYDEDNEKEVKGDIIQDMKELDMITKKINKENKRLKIAIICF